MTTAVHGAASYVKPACASCMEHQGSSIAAVGARGIGFFYHFFLFLEDHRNFIAHATNNVP